MFELLIERYYVYVGLCHCYHFILHYYCCV